MLEAKIFYMLEVLKSKCLGWYETCSIPCIYVKNLKSLAFLFLFLFVFELLGIFMVMIKIIKMELINATENCLINIFSARNYFFLPTELILTYPILIWSRSISLYLILSNKLHKILSKEWELKDGCWQNFLVGKELEILLLTNAFP